MILMMFVLVAGFASAQCDPMSAECQQQALCEGCWAAARESCYLAGQMSDYLYAWCVLYYGYFCSSYGCEHANPPRPFALMKQPADRPQSWLYLDWHRHPAEA